MNVLLKSCIAVTLLASPAVVHAQSSAPGASITLSNSGRTLVRRMISGSFAAGMSTNTIAIGLFTPATFAVLEPGVRLVTLSSDDGLSEEILLRRNVGRTFDVDTGKSGYRKATLIGLDPERWQWADRPAGIMFRRPGLLSWPPELVPAQPTAQLTLQSDRARSSIRTMYATEGATWAASYQLFLGASGHLDGNALISTGTLDLVDAEVQLESGDIGRGQAPAAVAYKSMAAAPSLQGDMISLRSGRADEEAIGETHLYTLPGRTTFRPNSSFTASLFDPAPAKTDRRYVLAGALPLYGSFGQDGNEQVVPVSVAYHLDRKLGAPLGDLALPAGYVAVYDLDRSGRVQLVGQGNIGHTSPGVELFVNAGTAFDVTGRRIQTDYATTRTPSTPGVGTRTIATSGYRVVLKNAKDSAVIVEVREDHNGEWSVTESSVPAQKKSSSRWVFNVPVPARDSTVLTYHVRVVW